ncbi:hypothetical protein EJ04DRAFT_490440 [Polyplosphaeria fusca]|uniref:Nucleolar pre-ribosomal-associated protein 1 n=1 Tax=Polyplosphaeria fusca TaxID=682080 RepID=A0A9P4V1A8_9PLEO|nr:hypothetical protein EJ04DRAFT_490440 [Polyplosphaeria fusca]
MGKRAAPELEGRKANDTRHVKRQRLSNSAEGNPPLNANVATEEVASARQLQKLLVFEQGAASELRAGLNAFKTFLESILYSHDDLDLPRKRAILREYLDTQKNKRGEDSEANFLPNFIQAWEYAAETNFEALLSQVVANLALLFRVFCTDAQFAVYASLLSKAVLQHSVVRRLNRTLSAPASKEYIISPVLRLLTEVTKYNQGAFAKAVYGKRDNTLDAKLLAKNIALWRDSKDDPTLEQRRPSIRTHAVRYLLAHLKYQDELIKSEILSNTIIVRAVFDHLFTDPSFLIYEIFDVMTNHVFQDKAITRHIKSRILTGKTLTNISSLYRHESIGVVSQEEHKTPDVIAHEFLSLVCTSPAYGIMLPSNGYYPAADDDGDTMMEDAFDQSADFGIDNDGVGAQGNIRNVILAEFCRQLKPHANTLQQELVVKIFGACPELIADYFLQKDTFQYDPKLTSTWIGYSSFLYQVINLPVPTLLGGKRAFRRQPPPVSTLVQSILPQPLTQQALTRALNLNSDLVNMFAVRVLVVAFQKLRAIVQEFDGASQNDSSQRWDAGSKRLIAEFCKRCPPMKAVITASRQPAFQKDMMREAITRLLRLYYEVTPQVALQERFDVSIPLCNTLNQIEQPGSSPDAKSFRILELEHWIQMARLSTTMRWWQKNKSLQHSPFVTLVKLVSNSVEGGHYEEIKSLLLTISQDYDLLQNATFPDALDTLIASLKDSCGPSPAAPEVFDFLDDCCGRFVKTPIKYFDDLDNFRCKISEEPSQEPSDGPISPLLMTIVEQWPFKGSKVDKEHPADSIAHWLARLLYLLKLVGEDGSLLKAVRDSLVAASHPLYREVLKESFLWKMGKEKAKRALKSATGADFSGSERSSKSPAPIHQVDEDQVKKDSPTIDLEIPPREDEKHAGLNRWRKKELDESIDDGDIGDLLLCLCSQHAEIRLQAAANIRQLEAGIDVSFYSVDSDSAANTLQVRKDSEHVQLKLLLGEVLETVQDTLSSEALPYVGGTFAARAVAVLADPTHFMFGKVNDFLMKRPTWNVERLPHYFGRKTVQSEPDQDGSYHKEVDWYLDYLIDALRTSKDMEIFRTKNVFERLLAHYASPSCAISAREKITRLLLRAVAVGGSTTLITRCGIISWLQMRLGSNDHRHQMLRLLAFRLGSTCDRARVEDWSSGTAGESLALLAHG